MKAKTRGKLYTVCKYVRCFVSCSKGGTVFGLVHQLHSIP